MAKFWNLMKNVINVQCSLFTTSLENRIMKINYTCTRIAISSLFECSLHNNNIKSQKRIEISNVKMLISL